MSISYGKEYPDAPWPDPDVTPDTVPDVDPYIDVPLPAEPPVDDRQDDRTAAEKDNDRDADTEFYGAGIPGGAFIFDRPDHTPAIWGIDNEVLWAEGEALMIAGPQGLGKTTLAGLLVRSMAGLGGDVLGLPVQQRKRILYLAMDRPAQIARAFKRSFNPAERDTIDRVLVFRPGPPPQDLAKHPSILAAMAEHYDADTVIVDSLKDAAIGLSEDDVGAGWNRARQALINSGRDLAELHHVKKPSADKKTPDINDVYGSTWLTSGCGSVILLGGLAGDPVVAFNHVKSPAEECGPWTLLHDQSAGLMSISGGIDVVEMAATTPGGITAREAAIAIFKTDRPKDAEIEKTRRRLNKCVKAGLLITSAGLGGNAVSFYPAPGAVSE